MNLPPIATTTVGSFPRPVWLAERDGTSVHFRLDGGERQEAQDDATIVCLRAQADIGLDLLTDGEQRRPHFISHVLAGLEGVDVVERRIKAVYRRQAVPRPVPRIVGPVRRRGPLILDDLRFAKAQTTRPIKMAVPGPMTVVDSTYDELYGDEAALALDVAAALNAELLDLQAAGSDVLQIDEPAMTRYHEKVAAYGAHALDRCLEGITVPTVVHLCYGYPGVGGQQHEYEYPELLAMLLQTRIAGFSMEFARSGYDPAILRHCGDRLILYGCVDPSDAPVEPLDVVVGRVRAALEYVAPSNLLLAPDCGLMTVSRDQARAKTMRLGEAAQVVRRAL
jgi:5-methyltetrahydropteroyltriglutamate--homocysteine methyltransferase